MEPNFKLMLDEMKSMQTALEGSIAAVNLSLGTRIGAVERTISDRFGRLEDAAKVFDEWKPTVDESVKDLRAEIGAIRKSEEVVDKMREEMTALRKTVSRAALDATPSAAAGVLSPLVVTTAGATFGVPCPGVATVGMQFGKLPSVITMTGASCSVTPPPTGSAARASLSIGPKVTGLLVGHGVEHHHRGFEFQTLSPVKGTHSHFPPYTHPHP